MENTTENTILATVICRSFIKALHPVRRIRGNHHPGLPYYRRASFADVSTILVLAVIPETKCQGLFSTPTIHCMKKATVDFSTMAPKSFFIHF